MKPRKLIGITAPLLMGGLIIAAVILFKSAALSKEDAVAETASTMAEEFGRVDLEVFKTRFLPGVPGNQNWGPDYQQAEACVTALGANKNTYAPKFSYTSKPAHQAASVSGKAAVFIVSTEYQRGQGRFELEYGKHQGEHRLQKLSFRSNCHDEEAGLELVFEAKQAENP